MARSVLVANAKGGVGKTTVATTLAAGLARTGARVALADADRQRSSLRWVEARPSDADAVEALDWSRAKEIGDAPKGIDWLVIDAPGALKGDRAEKLAAEADVVVAPVTPSPLDVAATASFLEALAEIKRVRKGKAEVVLVANRLRRGRAAAAFEAEMARRRHDLAARIGDRAAYAELAGEGLSVFDRPQKAYAALRAEWAPLFVAIGARAPEPA